MIDGQITILKDCYRDSSLREKIYMYVYMCVCVCVIFKMCMIFKIKMLNHDKTSRIPAKKEKEMKCPKINIWKCLIQ